MLDLRRKIVFIPAVIVIITFLLAALVYCTREAQAQSIGSGGISSSTYNPTFFGTINSGAGTAIVNHGGWQNLHQITAPVYPAISLRKTNPAAMSWEISNSDGWFRIYNSQTTTYPFSIYGVEVTVDSVFVISNSATITQGAACNPGRIVWDVNYIYVCTTTNTWKRAALTAY